MGSLEMFINVSLHIRRTVVKTYLGMANEVNSNIGLVRWDGLDGRGDR